MAKVRELMSRQIVGVSVDTTVDSARKLMNSMHVELIPVLSEGKLHGILIDSDLRDAQGHERVAGIMRKPVFAEADSEAGDAARKLVENAFGRIPVVNNRKEMRCIGIISTTDIVKSLK